MHINDSWLVWLQHENSGSGSLRKWFFFSIESVIQTWWKLKTEFTCCVELKSKRSSLECCYIDPKSKTCIQDPFLWFKAARNATQHLLLRHYFHLFIYKHFPKHPSIKIVLCFPFQFSEPMLLKFLVRSHLLTV